jgi:hypothetical protein
MRRVLTLGVAATAVAMLGFVVLTNLLSPADAAIPARLSGYINPARDIARGETGPGSWWPMPLRLAETGCAPDGLLVVYAFDTFIPSNRAYVVMQLSPVTTTATPMATTVLAPLTRDELEDPARNLMAILAQPCT